MTILVTGGAGFIGSHFIECLLADERDARIVCLDNFNDSYDPAAKRGNVALSIANPRVTLVEGSLCDAELLGRLLSDDGVRSVVHLGGLAGVRASVDEPLAYEEANVRGTLTLLEASRSSRLERFVLVSSSTVYGLLATPPFREDQPLGTPLSPYGATKRAAELLGLTYHALHHVPVVCVRPFSVYGPRMRPDLAMRVFAEAIVNGRAVPLLGDGTAQRDFTHVSDVCAGLLSALRAPGVEGQAINLGHNEPATVRELVSMLEAALGRKALIETYPAAVGDMSFSCADLTKAEQLLGYRPRVSLSEGVRDFAAWFLRTIHG